MCVYLHVSVCIVCIYQCMYDVHIFVVCVCIACIDPDQLSCGHVSQNDLHLGRESAGPTQGSPVQVPISFCPTSRYPQKAKLAGQKNKACMCMYVYVSYVLPVSCMYCTV
jgi:hypothetical protein